MKEKNRRKILAWLGQLAELRSPPVWCILHGIYVDAQAFDWHGSCQLDINQPARLDPPVRAHAGALVELFCVGRLQSLFVGRGPYCDVADPVELLASYPATRAWGQQ